MKTRIWGASDDLIEIDGAINDEVNDGTKKAFECSDGTKGIIEYGDDGNWHIELKKEGLLFDFLVRFVGEEPTKHTSPYAQGCSPYSDVLSIKDGVEWIKIGNKKFKPS